MELEFRSLLSHHRRRRRHRRRRQLVTSRAGELRCTKKVVFVVPRRRIVQLKSSGI